MARHSCRPFTALGFPCPGAVVDRAQNVFGEGEDELIKQRPPLVAHDMPKVMPPQLERWVFRELARRVVRWLHRATPNELHRAKEGGAVPKEELEKVSDIPIQLPTPSMIPIPEIIMTGAAAGAIMITMKMLNLDRGRSERFVAQTMQLQGKGAPKASSRGGSGAGTPAGQGFRFDAAADLRDKLKQLRSQGQGHDFAGILG